MTKHVHFIGIGGTGLSAIARVLLERDYTVSGSDQVFSPLARNLQDMGAQVYIGHQEDNIQGADLVVRSSAVPMHNVEIEASLRRGIPVMRRSEYLSRLLADDFVIAVAGTHGKTTTTAMLAWVLVDMGEDPSFIVGGEITNLGRNAKSGKGEHFVIEADEYDHMFLGLNPAIAVVTNIEHDHPDCFPTAESFYAAFSKFVGQMKSDGVLIACIDDPGARRLVDECQSEGKRANTYGLSDGANYHAQQIEHADSGFTFTAYKEEKRMAEVRLRVPGLHNVYNALAVLAVIDLLGLSPRAAAKSLREFSGAGRRFDVLADVAGIVVIDDYAHHPTEIKATLQAARAMYPQHQIWAVWQPHTYSRTKLFKDDFASAFSDADQVIVTEIYASREIDETGFSSREVVESMSHPGAVFIPDFRGVTDHLFVELKSGSVVLVLSAGDATEISALLVERLSTKGVGDA